MNSDERIKMTIGALIVENILLNDKINDLQSKLDSKNDDGKSKKT